MICAAFACHDSLDKDGHLCCASHWNTLPPAVRQQYYRLKEKAARGEFGAHDDLDQHVQRIRAYLSVTP